MKTWKILIISDDVQGSLKEFLNYVAGKASNDAYVKKLDEAVKKARQNKEWRREYMTLFMRDFENQEIGREEGINKQIRDHIMMLLEDGRKPEEIADFCKYP